MKTKAMWMIALLVASLLGPAAHATEVFNGHAENQIDSLGYYYALTGGIDPDGNGAGTIGTNGINGAEASGGTLRYITDDPYWETSWGIPGPIDEWQHWEDLLDWSNTNMSLAMTFKNEGVTVYDNNGIENGTYGNYYDATAQGLRSENTPGLWRCNSMSTNYDWVSAGEFIIFVPTTIDTMSGYFNANSGFDPAAWDYRMNIWSSTSGYAPGMNAAYNPTNTNSFIGDVFSSDNQAGTFTWLNSGADLVWGESDNSRHEDILRLTYALDNPITLEPGVYFFEHDAVNAVPEPISMVMLGCLGAGMAAARKLRRKKA